MTSAPVNEPLTTRIRRLGASRLVEMTEEHREVCSVRAPCPICKKSTTHSVELNLPVFVAIVCGVCDHAPPPYLLRDTRGPDGIIPSDREGAIRVLMCVESVE